MPPNLAHVADAPPTGNPPSSAIIHDVLFNQAYDAINRAGQGVYNVLEVGTAGGGVADDSATLASTDTANAGNGVTYVPPTTAHYRLGANVTLAHALRLAPSAQLWPDSGKVLTLNGPLSPPPGAYQVFGGAGTVVLGTAAVAGGVRPEWFGAVGDDATDDTAALNKMAAACPANAEVVISRLHKVAGTFTWPTGGGVTIRATSPGAGFDCGSAGQVNADSAVNPRLEHLLLTGTTTSYLFHCQGATDPTVINVLCNGGQRQLYFNTCARPRTTGTRHTAPNTAGAATTLECITCYQCTDPVIDQPIVGAYVAPVNASNFAPIRMELSTNPVVNLPQVTGVDMSQTVASAGVMFDGCAGGVLNAPQVSGCKGADGLAVINNGATRSTDVVVTGGYSTGNNPSAGAGTHSETGDGLDIFQSDRVLVTGINLRGNGVVGPHYNLEIASCTEVQVENVNASDGGYGGVSINASTDTKLGKVVARRNKGSGCYVQGASTNTALVECEMDDNNQGAGNPAIMQCGVYWGDGSTGRMLGGSYRDTRAGASRTQAYGVSVQNTASVYAHRADLTNNVTGAVNIGASGLVTVDCPGNNPGPTVSFTPGGSPYTATEGSNPATHYIYGGTVSGVVKNGKTLATGTSATVPVVVEVEPYESVVTTYTVAPTYVRDIH